MENSDLSTSPALYFRSVTAFLNLLFDVYLKQFGPRQRVLRILRRLGSVLARSTPCSIAGSLEASISSTHVSAHVLHATIRELIRNLMIKARLHRASIDVLSRVRVPMYL